jgi:hypothetical protein
MSKVERALKLTNAALEQMREQNRCEGIPSSLICAYSWLEEIADLLQPPADTIPVRVALAMGFDDDGKVAYSATGYSGGSDKGMMDNAQEFLSDVAVPAKVIFLTANVKPPTTEVETVDAEVSDA